MSDHETALPVNASTGTDQTILHQRIASAATLRCQWCSVPLEAGITVCPTCGSPGIPDPQMSVPGLTDAEISRPDPLREAVAAGGVASGELDLVEWWPNNTSTDDLNGERSEPLSFEDVERRRMLTLGFIGGAVIICALLGWLIGPSLIEAPFERLTGTTVEDPDDLRSMGTFGGLIAGMVVGATGGWVIWSNN